MKFLIIFVVWAVSVDAQETDSNYSVAVTPEEYYSEPHIEPRIINGSPARQGQFPYQASVTIFKSNGGAFVCGGSLISPRWILTAAHCVQGASSYRIKLGGIIRSGSEAGSITVTTTTGFHHENYNSQYLINDIALIKLNSNVPLSNNIRVIQLPSRSEVQNSLVNVKVTVSGWGKTNDRGEVSNILNYVQLTTISNTECANTYGTVRIKSSSLCAKGVYRKSTCNGDSGGPLVRYSSNGHVTQVGIVSFVSSTGCGSGQPSGYVRCTSYLDWINRHTGIPIRP